MPLFLYSLQLSIYFFTKDHTGVKVNWAVERREGRNFLALSDLSVTSYYNQRPRSVFTVSVWIPKNFRHRIVRCPLTFVLSPSTHPPRLTTSTLSLLRLPHCTMSHNVIGSPVDPNDPPTPPLTSFTHVPVFGSRTPEPSEANNTVPSLLTRAAPHN